MASPFVGTTTSQNDIRIVFDPAVSITATDCKRIADVQFSQMTADGTAMLPGSYYTGYNYQDPVTTPANYWVIDFLKGEKTPDYQQGGLRGQLGYINIAGTRIAWITDRPQTGGGAKKFYDPVKNPGGWKKVVFNFVTYCWCMQGGQCDGWYEALTWTFTKTWENQRDGLPGLVAVVDDNLAPPPSAELISAFDLFNSYFGYVPCASTKALLATMERVS
jgi:hypothetical protein